MVLLRRTEVSCGWPQSVLTVAGNSVQPMGIRSRLGRRAPALSPDVEAAVRAAIIPLASLHSGTSLDDLAGWEKTLDGVRVVGLGEATHGTREFFTLKHRLVEHLVLEHGFTVVAFEADTDGCRPLDTYVTTGRGDPVRALRELGYWTWNTEEVLDMLRWVRAHNAGTPAGSAVRFVGVDPSDERRRRSATRDRAMADAVLELAHRDQVRVAFWAHNGHVSTWADAAGSHLREELGAAYYPLALAFYHGGFQSLSITIRGLRGPKEFTVAEPPKRSIEDTLGRLATGDFILDLRDTAGSPALHAWATAKHQMRAYGSITLPGPLAKNQTAQVIPARDFDGIAFVRHTSRARPVRRPRTV